MIITNSGVNLLVMNTEWPPLSCGLLLAGLEPVVVDLGWGLGRDDLGAWQWRAVTSSNLQHCDWLENKQ